MAKLQYQDLTGKVAVVTGGGRGIGRAIVLDIATRGGLVLVTHSSAKSAHNVESIASEVASLYSNSQHPEPKVIGTIADILSPNHASAIIETLNQHFGGKLDILVLNAAVMEIKPVGMIEADHVQRMLFGNIQTPVLLIEELVRKEMFRPNSRIVAISSDAARRPRGAGDVYSGTKSAIESMTRGWADNLGRREFMLGTTVNAVSVGLTKSDAWDALPEAAQKRVLESDLPTISVGLRIAETEDIADIVGFLVSKKSRWVSGSVVGATGGAVKIL